MDKKMEDVQNELKLLKNEIKETLTDIRGYLLTNVQNPFPVELAGEAPPRQGNDRQPSRPNYADDLRGEPRAQQPQVVQNVPLQAPTPGAAQMAQTIPSQIATPVPTPANLMDTSQGTTITQAIRGDTLAASAAPTVKASESDTAKGKGEDLVRGEVNGHQTALDAGSVTMTPDTESKKAPTSKGTEPKRRGKEDKVDSSQIEQITLEQGKRAQKATQPRTDSETSSAEQDGTVDLLTLISLATWMEDGVSRLGRERVKSMVELYGAMGGLSPQLKDVLLRLASLDEEDGSGARVTLRECLRVLLDLDNLVLRGRPNERRPLTL